MHSEAFAEKHRWTIQHCHHTSGNFRSIIDREFRRGLKHDSQLCEAVSRRRTWRKEGNRCFIFIYHLLRVLLFLLIGSCPVSYPVCLFFCNVDAQLSHQRFSGLGLHFLRFLQAGYHPSCLHDLFMFISWFRPILWQLEPRGCCGCLRCEFYPAK
jgi:hypothetical protein